MKIRLVKGACIRNEGSKRLRSEAEGPSSSTTPISTNEAIELLWSLHLQQAKHFDFVKGFMQECTQVSEDKIDHLEVKIDNECIEIHQRFNLITSQLNQI